MVGAPEMRGVGSQHWECWESYEVGASAGGGGRGLWGRGVYAPTPRQSVLQAPGLSRQHHCCAQSSPSQEDRGAAARRASSLPSPLSPTFPVPPRPGASVTSTFSLTFD